jgi:cytochrome c oxidase subunit 2
MLALFVGWSAFFVYVLVRFRRGAHPVARPDGPRAIWVVLPTALTLVAELALLLFYSIPAWRARVNDFPPMQSSVVVRVVAEQFAWNIHYPGPDGLFGRTDVALVSSDNPLGLDRRDPAARDDVTTINQLHVPLNRPVIVFLSSKDVIHSFTLPQMRVKQDATPGLEQPVWFTPTRAGSWEIVCSQLCGLAHYRMRGFYTAETDAQFQQWLTAEAVLPTPPRP